MLTFMNLSYNILLPWENVSFLYFFLNRKVWSFSKVKPAQGKKFVSMLLWMLTMNSYHWFTRPQLVYVKKDEYLPLFTPTCIYLYGCQHLNGCSPIWLYGEIHGMIIFILDCINVYLILCNQTTIKYPSQHSISARHQTDMVSYDGPMSALISAANRNDVGRTISGRHLNDIGPIFLADIGPTSKQ
jgi:hypothetical protein